MNAPCGTGSGLATPAIIGAGNQFCTHLKKNPFCKLELVLAAYPLAISGPDCQENGPPDRVRAFLSLLYYELTTRPASMAMGVVELVVGGVARACVPAILRGPAGSPG